MLQGARERTRFFRPLRGSVPCVNPFGQGKNSDQLAVGLEVLVSRCAVPEGTSRYRPGLSFQIRKLIEGVDRIETGAALEICCQALANSRLAFYG